MNLSPMAYLIVFMSANVTEPLNKVNFCLQYGNTQSPHPCHQNTLEKYNVLGLHGFSATSRSFVEAANTFILVAQSF